MSVYEGHGVTLHHGDCLDVLRTLPDASVDSVVTDPPYGLEFMGKDWDAPWKASSVGRGVRVESERAAEMTERGKGHSTPGGPFLAARVDSTRVAGKPFQRWCEAWATECLRVLKPGGHLLAFGGTRTWHRLACAVEDAGFEVRDSIAWMYGQGFPKSLDVGKAIDKAAGAERTEGAREWSGGQRRAGVMGDNLGTQTLTKYDTPATPEAAQWAGWGTALKPAFEPVVVARKPLTGTVAANVLAHGTGALNIDGCRNALRDDEDADALTARSGGVRGFAGQYVGGTAKGAPPTDLSKGRWPANVVLDESQAEALDEQSGESVSRFRDDLRSATPRVAMAGGMLGGGMPFGGHEDSGGASRFFYVAKADASERPRLPKRSLRLRDDLTPEQVDHVRARLVEAGVQVD